MQKKESEEIDEVLSFSVIGGPGIGYIQTFIFIGDFEEEGHVNFLLKYIKTNVFRSMLELVKMTQNNAFKETWSKVLVRDSI